MQNKKTRDVLAPGTQLRLVMKDGSHRAVTVIRKHTDFIRVREMLAGVYDMRYDEIRLAYVGDNLYTSQELQQLPDIVKRSSSGALGVVVTVLLIPVLLWVGVFCVDIVAVLCIRPPVFAHQQSATLYSGIGYVIELNGAECTFTALNGLISMEYKNN